MVTRDSAWVYQAYIKIHATVLQKSLTYKRLFGQWREKGSKAGAGRLCQRELEAGLKKLKAGLTADELSKVCAGLPYGGKDLAIDFEAFQNEIIAGAKTLEKEQSYERLLLIDWI